MRLNEITEDKIDFKRKLKYPMELVNGITQEIEQASKFADASWVKVDIEQEYGDDSVSWTIEVIYQPKSSLSEIGHTIEKIYQAVVRNYQWEDISLTYHLLNREEAVDESSGYLLMGIQLDV